MPILLYIRNRSAHMNASLKFKEMPQSKKVGVGTIVHIGLKLRRNTWGCCKQAPWRNWDPLSTQGLSRINNKNNILLLEKP